MTILGKHSVAEVEALGNRVAYEFKQVDAAFDSISTAWKNNNQARYAKLAADWTKAKAEWQHTWNGVQTSLKILRASKVSDDIIPAETEWTQVKSHTAGGGRNADDSLYMTKRYVEEINGHPVDLSAAPDQLHVTDTDMDVLRETNRLKGTAQSKLLYVGIGATGALALVTLAKIYFPRL